MASNNSPSPYDVVLQINQSYVDYRRMHQLDAHKPYKMYAIYPTEHEKYGKGQMAYLLQSNDIKVKTQLPSKYLGKLGNEGIATIKKDITNRNYPFLVYREQLPGGSYRMDVFDSQDADKMAEYNILDHFKNWTNVSELPKISPTSSVVENDHVVTLNGDLDSNTKEAGNVSQGEPEGSVDDCAPVEHGSKRCIDDEPTAQMSKKVKVMVKDNGQ